MTLEEMHLENSRMNRMREYERMYRLIEVNLKELINGKQDKRMDNARRPEAGKLKDSTQRNTEGDSAA